MKPSKKLFRSTNTTLAAAGRFLLLLLAWFCLYLAPGARAASITWGTPVTISADTDVSTSGTLVYAYDEQNAATTVNTVPFAAGNSSTSLGSGNVTMSGFTANVTSTFGASGTGWNSLSSSYQTVLNGAAYGSTAAATITLNNLIVGHSYLVQVWVNDSRVTSPARSETVTSSGGNTVTLNYSSTPATAGGLGQYTIGTFTATATTQAFTMTGNASSQVNAIQVRDTTTRAYFNGASGATWDASTTADWGTATGGAYNKTWTTAGGGSSTVANFEGTAGSVSVSGTVNLGDISFAVDGYTLGGSGTLALGLGSGAITTGSGSDTISAVLSGTVGLTKYGSGTLTLGGANNYTGGTTLGSGTLALSGSGTLGNTSGALTINGGTLDLGGLTTPTVGAVSITGAGTLQNGSLTGTSYTDSHSSGTATVSAILKGSSVGLTKSGAGTLVLSGANTYTGATTLSGGTLQLQNATSLPSSAVTMSSGTTLQLRANSGATFSPSSFVESGSGTFTFDVNNNGSGTGQTLILANMGQFGAGSTTPTFAVTGGNNYTLQIGSGSSGTGALNVWNNTTLNANTAGVTLSVPGGISINFNTSYTLGFGGAGNISIGALTRNGANNLTPTFGGSGTITLNGANNFGAVTATVSTTGTLLLKNTSALTGISTLTISGAATIDNQSGAITLTNNPAQNWNSDFTFGSANTTGSLNLGTGTVTLGATRNVTVSSTTYGLTVGGVIGGIGFGLTKLGSGSLIVTNANTYSGATTVNNGRLVGVTGGSSASSPVTVQSSGSGNTATLSLIYTGANAQWTCSSLTTLAGTSGGNGPNLEFAFNTTPSGTTAPLAVSGNVTFTATPTITIDPANLTTGNTYPLLVVSGTAPSAVPTVTIGRGLTGTASWGGTGNKTLSVTISGTSTEPLKWATSTSGTWDINNNGNNAWKDSAGSPAATYYQEPAGGTGDQVVFNETYITAATAITLNSVLNPASVSVNNSTYNYTISGSGAIAGSASLTKSGSTTLTLGTANAYSGGTTISAGTLKLGVANAVPGNVVGGDVSVSGTLDLNTYSDTINGLNGSGTVDNSVAGTPTLTVGANGDSGSFSGLIKNTAGTLSLVKSGSGTQTLGSANTYGGSTTVNAGTLQMGIANTLPTATALTLSGTATMDLNSYNTSVANIPSSAATATITDNSGTAGTTTFTLNNQSSTCSALVKDGTTRTVAVNLVNANASSPPFALSAQNTFSGGLTLLHNASGTRINVNGAVTTTGSAGSISSSPFGRGTITIGQAATDKAQLLLSVAANNTIANAFTVNTALGSDVSGGFRIDTTGNTLSGAINANLADATFNSGGSGSVTLSGAISGSAGLNLAPTSSHTIGVTLNNANNTYAGNTTVGTGGTLTLGAGDQIPNGPGKGNVSLTGTLNLVGFNETINGLTGAGTVDGVSGSPVFTIGDNNANGNTFSGVIKNTAGNLNLVKIGSGTQTLSGANTFSGGLNVNNGTISFASDGNTAGTGYPLGVYPASASATAVTLNGGGLLDTTTATISANRGITLGSSGGTLDASASQTLTVNSVVTGTGGLTKGANTGTVILAPSSGNNNYGGQTTISGGKLVVQSSQTGTGNFTVADGASLGVTVSGTSQLPPNTLTVGSSTGATLEFNNVTSTSVAPINAGTISSGGTLTITVNSGTFTAGQTYPLVTWTTGSAPTANLSSMLALGVTAHLVSTSTSLSLAVDSVSDIWTGGSNGNWDAVATGNWSGLHSVYADGDAVLFDDTATGTTNVTVNQVVQPGGIVVNNITKTYTFTSAANKFIGGSTSLTKTGSGTLKLSGGVNTNTGVTSINSGIVSVSTLANGGAASDIGSSANSAANLTLNGGTLQYTGATASSDRLFTVGALGATIDASGSGALNLNNTGSAGLSGSGARAFTLTGTNTGANTLAAVIGDNGGATTLSKSGAGSWTLSGANSYSGATTLSVGTLALTGSGTLGNGSSALTVGGGTLDLGTLNSSVGAVSITGAATVQDGSLTGTSYLDTHASGTVSVTAALLGSAGLTVSGGGTLGLSGTNAFTGVTLLANGTVNLLNDQRGMTGGFWVSTNNSATGTLNIGSASQTAATLALVNSGNLVQVGNNVAGGGSYGTINVGGTSAFATTVTNNGLLWVGRQSQFNVNAYGNWIQNGDFMEQEQGGYWANFTVAANGSFTYAGVNPINLTVGGSVNDNLTISGTFTTGQGFNFNDNGTSYPVLTLSGGGKLALSANISQLITASGTGAAGQFSLGSGGGVIDTAGFGTTIGYPIGSSGSLTKAGLGTLTLSGTNTYTGASTVSAGTLTIDTTGVIGGGASGSAITVNGGTLTDNSTVATTGGIAGTSSLTISSGTANLNTANNYSGATSVTGTLLAADTNACKNSAVTLNNGATLQLRNNSATAFNSSGAFLISGQDSNLTIDVNNNGTGTGNPLAWVNGINYTYNLASANTHTDTINVTGNNGYSLIVPSVVVKNTSTSGSGHRHLQLDFNPTTANVSLGNVTGYPDTYTSDINAELVLDGTTTGNQVTGTIAKNGTSGGAFNLYKNGTGTWTLSGANTYDGATTISAGTLALSGSGSLASPTITVAGGATFDVSGLSSTFTLGSSQTLANSGSTTANLVGNINTGSGTNLLTFAAGTPAFNIAGGTLNLSGSTVKVNNTGTVLGAGSYKLIGALSGGAVAVTLPAVSVTGGGTAGLASLQVIGGELYLNVVIPTALTLVSTPAGTNGYLDNVLFSAAVLTNGVAATNATGTVQFFTNGVVLVTNGLAGGTTNCSLSTLPRGTNLIAAVYSGDANYLPSTNNLYQVVTNHPPMAGNASYTRNQGIYSMRIPVAELLTNVTDADSDTITLVSTDVSSNGVTLLTVAVAGTNYLYYYSTNNIGDQFDYTVTDGFGGTNTGTVLMNLNATPVFGQDNVQLVSTNGGVQLTFFGVPGNTYVVQRNLTLDSGNWQDLNTNSATTSNPVMVITDTNNSQAFYRLRWLSSP